MLVCVLHWHSTVPCGTAYAPGLVAHVRAAATTCRCGRRSDALAEQVRPRFLPHVNCAVRSKRPSVSAAIDRSTKESPLFMGSPLFMEKVRSIACQWSCRACARMTALLRRGRKQGTPCAYY